MKKTETPIISDDLRPEYDLATMRVRSMGPKRHRFGEMVRLAPDVAELYPSADSVNEALRFLARVTREAQAASARTKS